MIIYFIALNLRMVWLATRLGDSKHALAGQVSFQDVPRLFFIVFITMFGVAYWLLFYGLVSLLFSLISSAFSPETTGKTSHEIEKFFEKKKELNRIGNIKEDDL